MEIINAQSVMEIGEILTKFTSPITVLFLTVFGWKYKFDIKSIKSKLEVLKKTNDKDHNRIDKRMDYINAREEIGKALRKVCVQSIAYTEGSDKVNAFKDTFTHAITDLSEAVLGAGFKSVNQNLFRTYMVSNGKKIRNSYDSLPKGFVEKLDVEITAASEIYYEKIVLIIKDSVFNDKNDRFSDATIQFLREELMIITKLWWAHNNINYKIIE